MKSYSLFIVVLALMFFSCSTSQQSLQLGQFRTWFFNSPFNFTIKNKIDHMELKMISLKLNYDGTLGNFNSHERKLLFYDLMQLMAANYCENNKLLSIFPADPPGRANLRLQVQKKKGIFEDLYRSDDFDLAKIRQYPQRYPSWAEFHFQCLERDTYRKLKH